MRVPARLVPRIRTGALLVTLLLSGCGGADLPDEVPQNDPVLQRALSDPLMTDPDLVSQNLANAALTFEIGHSLPPHDMSPKAVNAAREAALALLGGSSGLAALTATTSDASLSDVEALNILGRLQRLKPASQCFDQAGFSAIWAARMPDGLEPYPHGSTQAALGGDRSGCSVRAVLYLSPVPIEDIMAFHLARVRAAGYDATYHTGSEWQILRGEGTGNRFEITARKRSTGQNEIAIASIAVSR